ncbi:MAG: hypothetical protein GY858_09480 [Candidatus Omnitrophica bacterium]|nr:hypothetical protein [Candidatus Omnitrophota bacterium]
MNCISFARIYIFNLKTILLLLLIAWMIYLLVAQKIRIEVFVSLVALISTLWFSFLTPFYPRINIGRAIFLATSAFTTKGQSFMLPIVNTKLSIVNNNAIGGIIEDMRITIHANDKEIGKFYARREADKLQIISKQSANITPDVFNGVTIEKRSAKSAYVVFMPKKDFQNTFPKLPYALSLDIEYKIGDCWLRTKHVSFENDAVNFSNITSSPYGVLELGIK